jgi:hypothetical protein
MILGVYLLRHRNILVAESISKVTHQGLWEAHGILSDGGTWYP